jgi:adenine-specific DNA-methyltransferase
MPTTAQLRTRLLSKLKELFQLDQPDLDFGFYKVMHAKSEQVERFIDDDLLKIVEDAFAGSAADKVESEVELAKRKLVEAMGDDALQADGSVNPAFANTPAGKTYSEALTKAGAQVPSLSDEGQIYDHLFRFFERYYDNGDFVSRRYYTRETDGRAAPFAIPYHGEEVKLHWANADQYYIKTAEYFNNYTFDLTQAAEFRAMSPGQRALNSIPEQPVRVQFKIVDASEGEHGNVKADDDEKRFFIIHQDAPIVFDANGDLVVNFEYRVDPEKGKKQEGSWRDFRNTEATETILKALKEAKTENPAAETYLQLFQVPAPTGKDKKRPLLVKYLNQYTARNTMDYFIHKNLGGFLRRELDFYIKNEVMRLDDLDQADAPAVEDYLSKLKVLRKIAHKLVDFLAQLEDFQKKLWLKKKFVVETNYCITLDRVPEELYPEIITNQAQHDEWVKLFAIDEIEATEGDLMQAGQVGYSNPLSLQFLKENDKLVLDTRHFSSEFKAQLLGSISDFEDQLNGQLVHSENLQALNLLGSRFNNQIQTFYIDPPYNTGGDGFAYKDAYQHASWITMAQERIESAYPLLSDKGVLFSSIDENERTHLELVLNNVFESKNRIEEIIWVQNTTKNQSPTYSTNHEYVEVYARNDKAVKAEHAMFRESKPGYIEINELIDRLNPNYPSVEMIEQELRSLFRERKKVFKELAKDGEAQEDDWKGIYNYNRVEYRDSTGLFVEESKAQKKKASIWVWREDNPSMPQIKQDSQKAEFRDPKSPTYRFYRPIHPITGKESPAPKRGWSWPYNPHGKQKNCFSGLAADHRIAWGDDENKIPQTKRYLHEVESNVAKSVLSDFTDGEKELTNLFGQTRTFGGPKPTTLIQRFCDQASLKSGWFCDFFAGSGTSGQAVLAYNREKEVNASYLLVESGPHFNSVVIPRMKKVIYSANWNSGKPTTRDTGLSHCFKYIRLESYEDTLNNLSLSDESLRANAIAKSPSLKEDYMLRYMLEMETQGSQSLLNIDAFSDPTGYQLSVKKSGSDEQEVRTVDLIETFNYLLGLRVTHYGAPQSFTATFKREADPELPEDTDTKLTVDGTIKQETDGAWWFRKVEGWVPKNSNILDQVTRDTAGAHNHNMERILIVWRKLTGDLEQDNLMLDTWFRKHGISTQDYEFDTIYVNGSNNLPNLKADSEHWKVRLIEEEFMKRMWEETT